MYTTVAGGFRPPYRGSQASQVAKVSNLDTTKLRAHHQAIDNWRDVGERRALRGRP